MRDFITIDADGQPRINLSQTPPEALDAIAEIHTETVVDSQGRDAAPIYVRRTRIKLVDKLAALDKLLRHLGGCERDNAQGGTGAASLLAEIWARGGSRMPIRGDDDEPPAPASERMQ